MQIELNILTDIHEQDVKTAQVEFYSRKHTIPSADKYFLPGSVCCLSAFLQCASTFLTSSCSMGKEGRKKKKTKTKQEDSLKPLVDLGPCS